MNKMIAFKDKYSRLALLIYAILWLTIFLIPLGMEVYDVRVLGNPDGFNIHRVMSAETLILPIFLLFLLNNFVLLPRLFFNKRKVLYMVCLVACFALLWYIQVPPGPHHHGAHPAPDSMRPPFDMFHLTNLIIEISVVLANFAIYVYVGSLRRDVLLLNARNEKMQSELESLKYQISPHFFMNTLNNIQALIETDPHRAYVTIQGLSRMMRYLLYENNTHTVSLQKEVGFMSDFIELMKIRYPDSVQVSAQFPERCEGVSVPPLLFISFLENAFKYGVSYVGESFVTVNMSIEGGHLMFRCANSKKTSSTGNDHRKGIGIENVRRRLELIYGDDYSLNITDNDTHYIVAIELPVKLRGELSKQPEA